jgi:hypothetical protein
MSTQTENKYRLLFKEKVYFSLCFAFFVQSKLESLSCFSGDSMCAAAAATPDTHPNSAKGSSPFVSTNIRGEQLGQTREVGNQATWSLSSCKPGNLT